MFCGCMGGLGKEKMQEEDDLDYLTGLTLQKNEVYSSDLQSQDYHRLSEEFVSCF